MADLGWYTQPVDGVFGRYTQAALQSYLKRAGKYTRAVDGDFGPQSVLALQKHLKNHGVMRLSGFSFYAGKLDGIEGKMTWQGAYDFVKAVNLKYNSGGIASKPWPGQLCTKSLQKFLNDAR